MSLVERYLGEATTDKVNQAEKFKGETTPTDMDNTSKFLGETNPSEMNNQSQFLGETTPTDMDNTSKFLGETTPTEANKQSQFLGETTPTEANKQSQFLGETNTKPMSLESGFLGETTPLSSDRSSNFLGETTPSLANNESKFLGETTPSEMKDLQFGDKFLGETTPDKFRYQAKLEKEGKTVEEVTQGDKPKGETTPAFYFDGVDKPKGETTPSRFPYKANLENEGKTPGEVNYIQDIHATGFNSKFGGVTDTKFIGVNPDNTKFDIANSKYSDYTTAFAGLDTSPGYGKFKLQKQSSGQTQKYNPTKSYYSDDTKLSNKSISQIQEMRNSPSFLDEMYHKFNLRDDAYNSGMAAFDHPLILRGIQRKKITKGEPQLWGLAGVTFDDGLIRGGVITSTVRAAIDAVRIGKWMVSVKGLLFAVKQFGLQNTNSNVETTTGKRLTKMWTPVNTLASVIGQHIGLHPRRHGFLPLPEKLGPEKYEEVQNTKTIAHNIVGESALTSLVGGNRLAGLYDDTFSTVSGLSTSRGWVGKPFLRLQGMGGPNSLYGLIPGGKVPTRTVNTRYELYYGNNILDQYNPIANDPSTSPSAKASTSTPFDRDETKLGEKYGEAADGDDGNFYNFAPDRLDTPDPNDSKNKFAGQTHNQHFKYEESRNSDLQDSDYEGTDLGLAYEAYSTEGRPSDGALNRGVTHTSKENPFAKLKITDGNPHPIEKLDSDALIKQYETNAYGTIPTRIAGDPSLNDFRKSNTGTSKKHAEAADYNGAKKTIHTRFNIGNSGKVSDTEDRVDFKNKTTGTAGNKDRYDKIQAQSFNSSTAHDDLVPLVFKANGRSNKIQFRGTVSGITDSFSPSWDTTKYNGRADQAYNYTTFERSLSFNFQVYATSRIEMKPIFSKLGALASMTMPVYSSGNAGYHGVLVNFTLGDLFLNELTFIETLTYTVSDETPWDTIGDDLGVLPMGIDVSIGLKILDNTRPSYGSTGVFNSELSLNGI